MNDSNESKSIDSSALDRLSEVRATFNEPQAYFQKRNYHVRVRKDVVGEFLKESKFDRILDIGCGNGTISLPLLTRENRLTLLDMSEGMLARARSLIPADMLANVDILKSDFMGAELNAGTYDLIVCLGVVAYIDSIELFLAKVASLLKPGGQLILEWTDGYHFVSRLLRCYHTIEGIFVPPNVRLTSHRTSQIIEELESLGFDIIGSYRYCSPLPILRRLFGEEINYGLIRLMHGRVSHNRTRYLGEECIFHFRKVRPSSEIQKSTW